MTKVLFMGRKPVAARSLAWLCERKDVEVVAVVTDSHLSVSPTKDVAEKYAIPVIDRDQAEKAVLAGELAFDIGLSMLYWQKIRKPLLDAAAKGIVNFHPAPLPHYKGTAGYNLAILEQREDWAVSAHYVDGEFDTGEIVDVAWFSIDPDYETAQSLERKSQPYLAEQFQSVVSRMIASDNRLPTAPNSGGRYVSRAEMEAMKEVREGDDVDRKIRAFWFPPYDGAFKMVNGVKCTLVNRQILETLADPASSSLFTAPSD